MPTRRSFLRSFIACYGGLSLGSLYGCKKKRSVTTEGHLETPLLPPDENGLMLPSGYSSRVIANTGLQPNKKSSYKWHKAPDGGATFPTDNGGWIYVSNSEVGYSGGGVGAIQFDASGAVVSAFSILDKTSRNCAGGATPWETWLSCEEINKGIVWECDPYGKHDAVALRALGKFRHEAVAVDTRSHYIYMTEDVTDGCFYRFVPTTPNLQGIPDLSSGTLEVAVVDSWGSKVHWLPVPDPSATSWPTRNQVHEASRFNGGEGIVFYEGTIYFATKNDGRIWGYDTVTHKISVIYDATTLSDPIIDSADNITLSQKGELVVCADSGILKIVIFTREKGVQPLVQLVGHDGSELTGPAFSPDGSRLYFSSQRGVAGGSGGVTFEVSGPFHV